MAFKPSTEFDRERFDARIGAMKGPTHIVDRHWVYNRPFNNHNDGSEYAEEMVRAGIWQKCCSCGKVFSPVYGHEHLQQVETQQVPLVGEVKG